MKLTNERIHKFQNMILNWWQTNRRDLPWRHTHDPYKILVSEIMLQQTQVSRVLARYTEFIEVYPTARSLARATAADVLRLWKGMGYNRRALYLKKAAEIGKFPKSEKELSKLPGVGTYTARAILVFAYKKSIAAVDTNIRKIITHFFFDDILQSQAILQKVATKILPKGRSWEWHQALMDFGALRSASWWTHGNKKPHVPFKKTNRFFRGRIIDFLRDSPAQKKVIIGKLKKLSKKDDSYYLSLLANLEKEGLVQSVGLYYSLPD